MKKLKKSFVVLVFSLLACSLVFSENVYEITENQLLEIELNNQKMLEVLKLTENKLAISESSLALYEKRLETAESGLETFEKQLQEQAKSLQKSEKEKKILIKFVIPACVILSFAGGVYLGGKL